MADVVGMMRLRKEFPRATKRALAPFVGKEIDLLYELPYAIPESDCGVYFLFQAAELIYVGASKNLHNRMNRYHREKRYSREMGQWTQIGVMPVPDRIVFSVESWYIDRFKPRLNLKSKRVSNG